MVKPPKLSVKDDVVQEWRDRLEKDLKTGWTARRQTQVMVKAACTYGRVFKGLSWGETETYVLETLTKAPGYKEFCGHQRNIKQVVRGWIKTNRKSNRYYPLHSRQNGEAKAPTGSSNQQKQKQAEQKIQDAIAQIVAEDGGLPAGNTARANRIHDVSRCSLTTIYKYRALWDSEYLQSCVMPCGESTVENLAIAIATSQLPNVPVIVQPESVSEVCNFVYKTPQSDTGQDITHDSLLSIYGCLSTSRELKKSTLTPAAVPQQLEPPKTPVPRALEPLEGQAEELKIGSLWRYKATGEVFELRQNAERGRAWFKLKSQFVQYVACLFDVSEFEPYRKASG